ncbi:unnamed protein product [Prunus armeniaca]
MSLITAHRAISNLCEPRHHSPSLLLAGFCLSLSCRATLLLFPLHSRFGPLSLSVHAYMAFFSHLIMCFTSCPETSMFSYSLFIWVLLSPNLDSHTSSDLRGSDTAAHLFRCNSAAYLPWLILLHLRVSPLLFLKCHFSYGSDDPFSSGGEGE